MIIAVVIPLVLLAYIIFSCASDKQKSSHESQDVNPGPDVAQVVQQDSSAYRLETHTIPQTTHQRKSSIMETLASPIDSHSENIRKFRADKNGSMDNEKRIISQYKWGTNNAVILDIASQASGAKPCQAVISYVEMDAHYGHLKLHTKRGCANFMATLVDYSPREDSDTVFPYGAIYIKPFKTYASMQGPLHKVQERFHLLLNMCTQLCDLVSHFHAAGRCLGGISKDNLIQVECNTTNERWTLLDYSKSFKVKEGLRIPSQEVRTTPPELAQAMLDNSQSVVYPGLEYDMWQFGLTVYEILMDSPYWDPRLRGSEVLETLSSWGSSLPHEDRPVPQIGIQNSVLSKLLSRDPSKRPKAASLKMLLRTEMSNDTLTGDNMVTHGNTFEIPVIPSPLDEPLSMH